VWAGESLRVAYQAAKSGLVGLTRHTATLGGKHGVRTNLLSRGVILTKAALATTTEEYRANILAIVRSPRLGDPDDLAAMAAFLLSDDASYVTGANLEVSGGST
jgi:NAD(P)-dependent dehydrogenase (short-subunit alcohol dehydrogenase family)